MITIHVAAEIEQMAAAGIPRRKIARECRVSRTTVIDVLSGRWRRRYEQHQEELKFRGASSTRKIIGRCETCGATVELPCRACAVREWMKKQSENTEKAEEDVQ